MGYPCTVHKKPDAFCGSAVSFCSISPFDDLLLQVWARETLEKRRIIRICLAVPSKEALTDPIVK